MQLLPIPAITSTNQVIVDRIEELVDRIIEVKKLNPKADASDLERQIDQRVYEIYSLTEEEIAIIEGGK